MLRLQVLLNSKPIMNISITNTIMCVVLCVVYVSIVPTCSIGIASGDRRLSKAYDVAKLS